MKTSVLDYNLTSLTSKSAHAPLDRRYAERVPINYRVTYTGAEGARLVKTEGSLRDLSKIGCKVLGTILPVTGSTVTLTLYLEDGQAPLCLSDATVSWIRGSVFAIRFPKLTADERKRVQEVIWKHVTLSPSKNHRTAFRIVS
ncbi:MAG TPA: PilZ domain-containing protein [Nitrospira sp.]